MVCHSFNTKTAVTPQGLIPSKKTFKERNQIDFSQINDSLTLIKHKSYTEVLKKVSDFSSKTRSESEKKADDYQEMLKCIKEI
mmetsp:Transcript_36735/g.35489  ORF Transcript_36735/g.35489 Transcript_36735/m.35489 type:complete len:83 (-) Transcript_36735:407-655(-)